MSQRELDRKYRVLNQTLSMHSMLKSRYERISLLLDLVLMACSLVFVTAAFASDDIFEYFGFNAINTRYILGVAAAIAFLASLTSLRADWKGKSARHQDASKQLSDVLSVFRQSLKEDGTWNDELEIHLHSNYNNGMNNIVEIPTNKFNRLKSRHLRKVELSKMLDENPRTPIFILWFILLIQSLISVRVKRKE